MKKIIFILVLLVAPLVVHAENDYKVLTHYIDSEIEISGNLRVKEFILIDGDVDYFTRTLNYKTFDGVWDKKDTSLEDNPLYNGSGIYNFTVSAYKYNGEEIDDHVEASTVATLFIEDVMYGNYWWEKDEMFDIPEEVWQRLEDETGEVRPTVEKEKPRLRLVKEDE